MNLIFRKNAGCIIICFNPGEVTDALTLLHALVNDEKTNKGRDADFGKELFKNLSHEEEEPFILFSFKYFGVAIRFLEIVISVSVDNGNNPARLEDFLRQANEWYRDAPAVQ